MTLSEFKHWLDGFQENMDGAPTAEQWAKVQEKLADVSERSWVPPVMPSRRQDDWSFLRGQPYQVTSGTGSNYFDPNLVAMNRSEA